MSEIRQANAVYFGRYALCRAYWDVPNFKRYISFGVTESERTMYYIAELSSLKPMELKLYRLPCAPKVTRNP